MTEKLQPKHKALVDRYLVHRNGGRAAIEVGYSEAGARVRACEILARPEVKEYREAGEKTLEDMSRLAAYLVREELAIIGHSNIRNFVITNNGEVTLAPGAPFESWRAVSSVEYSATGFGLNQRRYVKIRLWPKDAALRMAGEHLAMFKQQLEVSGPDGGPIEVRTDELRTRIASRIAGIGSRISPMPDPAKSNGNGTTGSRI